ncbi:hypothetical protein MYX84_04205 [Acidobacteria bacterium AH-259-O06]|nr:hypothetical protein [Acidobacteria bacterium AH-259-O06]
MRKKLVIVSMLAFVLALGLTSWVVFAQTQEKVVITKADKAAAESQLATAKEALKKAKEKLQVAKEKCCLKPEVGGGLRHVPSHDGGLHLSENLLAGKAVCPECGLMWLKGKGLAPDKVKLSQVKTLIDVERENQGVKLEKE